MRSSCKITLQNVPIYNHSSRYKHKARTHITYIFESNQLVRAFLITKFISHVILTRLDLPISKEKEALFFPSSRDTKPSLSFKIERQPIMDYIYFKFIFKYM